VISIDLIKVFANSGTKETDLKTSNALTYLIFKLWFNEIRFHWVLHAALSAFLPSHLHQLNTFMFGDVGTSPRLMQIGGQRLCKMLTGLGLKYMDYMKVVITMTI